MCEFKNKKKTSSFLQGSPTVATTFSLCVYTHTPGVVAGPVGVRGGCVVERMRIVSFFSFFLSLSLSGQIRWAPERRERERLMMRKGPGLGEEKKSLSLFFLVDKKGQRDIIKPAPAGGGGCNKKK